MEMEESLKVNLVLMEKKLTTAKILIVKYFYGALVSLSFKEFRSGKTILVPYLFYSKIARKRSHEASHIIKKFRSAGFLFQNVNQFP